MADLRDGRWVPTFPNAKYIFHKTEYADWEALTKTGNNPPGNVWAYNCLPVVEAGQALLVDDTYALDETFTPIPTPGHSPFHCCVDIHSRGQRAIVTGDLMHHELQVRMPELYTVFDTDTAAGITSRRTFFESIAGTQAVLLPVHFPSPTAGRISRMGTSFDYIFMR